MESLTIYQSPYRKYRCGNRHDGGYVIVDLPRGYDAFYSGGISNDISFEEDFLSRYPSLICSAYDGTIDKLPKAAQRINFVKKNLGAQNTENLTNWGEELSPFKDVFIKMDIEGHEFKILPSFFESGVMEKVKQLVVEIHTPADIHLHPDYYHGLSDVRYVDLWSTLQQISLTHTLVHIHANNACNVHTIKGIIVPNVFECTFVRSDYISSRTIDSVGAPTSLDAPNAFDRPDIVLRGYPYTTRVTTDINRSYYRSRGRFLTLKRLLGRT